MTVNNRDLDLRDSFKPFEAKLKKIKACLFDVDGVLTNGQLYYAGSEVGFNRFFHAQDGYGLKLLLKAGIEVGIISGGDSLGVKERITGLGIKHMYLGNEDKRAAMDDFLAKTGLKDDECLYMGDEFFDLPLLKRAGFSASVPNSSIEIREAVDYVSNREGGTGAVREVIDLLRHAQGIVPNIEY